MREDRLTSVVGIISGLIVFVVLAFIAQWILTLLYNINIIQHLMGIKVMYEILVGCGTLVEILFPPIIGIVVVEKICTLTGEKVYVIISSAILAIRAVLLTINYTSYTHIVNIAEALAPIIVTVIAVVAMISMLKDRKKEIDNLNENMKLQEK